MPNEVSQEQVAFDLNDFAGGARAAIEAVLMVIDEPVTELSLPPPWSCR
jgi:segregation and condensation protein B